ncbi:MAG: transporter [Gammaproteobacteria bacterium]|nr:transporter [Gammaproteobacteria bacterium]
MSAIIKQYSQLLGIAASLLMGNSALAGDYTFSTGAEYTNGDYGAAINTTMLQVPFTLGYTNEKYAWSITVPYIQLSGSEDVTFSRTSHSPKFTTTTASTAKQTSSGLGDITLSGTYQLKEETNVSPWLALTGKIKLGTADEKKRLGTGENDYAVQVEVAKNALHGYLGYKIIGDTSTVNFNDVSYGAVGITIPVSKNWTSITEYYTEQASVSGVENIQEVNISFSKSLSNKKKFSIYAIKGLTNSSPDWGAGISLSYPL